MRPGANDTGSYVYPLGWLESGSASQFERALFSSLLPTQPLSVARLGNYGNPDWAPTYYIETYAKQRPALYQNIRHRSKRY